MENYKKVFKKAPAEKDQEKEVFKFRIWFKLWFFSLGKNFFWVSQIWIISRCSLEQGKYVPPVEHWREHEYDLYHSKKSNNFTTRKGDKNKKKWKNKGKKNGNDKKDNKAGGDDKPKSKPNECESVKQKYWNDLSGSRDKIIWNNL